MVTGARGAGQPRAEGEAAHFMCATIMMARFSTDGILVKVAGRRDGIVGGNYGPTDSEILFRLQQSLRLPGEYPR
jgi:hypothetical protein